MMGVGLQGSAALRSAIIGDPDGDALDSVVATWVTAGAIGDPVALFPNLNEAEMLEGYVYV